MKDMARQAARQKALRASRRLAGLCIGCGKTPPNAGMTLCQSCRERGHAAVARYTAKNPNKHRKSKLRRKYGWTEERFQSCLAAQGGRCAICRTDKPGRNGWHIDHCHATGRVRGILCPNCNNGLGFFGDDPALMRAGATYKETFDRSLLEVVA